MAEQRGADLDELFTQLEDDVASICSPPGAGLAVATARRRRRTTLGTVLAVVALIAGGLAIGAQLRHDASVPAAHRPLPAPKQLSADRLSSATTGWVSHFSPGVLLIPQLEHQSLLGLDCFAPEKALVADPASHTRRFTTTSLTVALFVVRELPLANAQELGTQLVDGLEPCRTVPEERFSYPGGATVAYASRLRETSSRCPEPDRCVRDLHVWVARRGDHVGLLVVGGAGNLPAYDTIDRVSDLLVAALAHPPAG